MSDKTTDIGKRRKNIKTERERWYQAALEVIRSDQRILFMRDVIDCLPISHGKFYTLFPSGSPELMNLQKCLDGNKVPQRLMMRQRMVEMNSPTTLLAIYKTIATPEERKLLASAQETEEERNSAEADGEIDIKGYQENVRETLKKVNRYSPVLELEISAMASAWATLEAANRAISSLSSPFLEEVTTQGKKIVPHPAYAMQQKALESMSRHAKLLGIDYENAPAIATDGPLVQLTRSVIDLAKGQPGKMTVSKEKNNGKKSGRRRKKKE